jgi:hypothetical protein
MTQARNPGSRLPTPRMRRISSIRSVREAELERLREELRNLRWSRRRSQLILGMTVLAALTLAALEGPTAALHLLRWLDGV